MDELKTKVAEICELKDKLMCAAKQEMAKGIVNVNTQEMGAVVDMIKDLADAEEKCWKACYYKKIVEAMDEEKEREEMMAKMGMEGGSDRMGYDHWHYANGRFAPTGHGHRVAGYTHPMMDGDEDPWMDMQPWDGSMGYNGGSRGGSFNSQGRSMSNDQNGSSSGSAGGSRMGYPISERGHRYDAYNKARMGFHESKDSKSKEHMDSTAKEYLVDVTETIREIWKESDPEMRKDVKNKLAALMNSMG